MVLLFKAQRLEPRPMWRVGNARRWLVEKTNLPAGHPARSWTALKAALCVLCLTWERHGEGELAFPATAHPARCGVRNPSRLGPRSKWSPWSTTEVPVPGKPAGPADKADVQSHPCDASMDGRAIRAGCGLPHAWQGGFRFRSVLLGCHQETCGPLRGLLASSYQRC